MHFQKFVVTNCENDLAEQIDNEALQNRKFEELGKYDVERAGFVPFDDGNYFFTDLDAGPHRGRYWFMKYRSSKKVIEKSEIAEKLKEFFAFDRDIDPEFKPDRKTQQGAKEQIIYKMLPTANIKTEYIDVCYDQTTQKIYIATSSNKHYENILCCMREALGSLPTMPIALGCDVGEEFDASFTHEILSREGLTFQAVNKFKMESNTTSDKLSIDDLDMIAFESLRQVLMDNQCIEGNFQIHPDGDPHRGYLVRIDRHLVVKKMAPSDVLLAEIQGEDDVRMDEKERILADFLINRLGFEMLLKFFFEEAPEYE